MNMKTGYLCSSIIISSAFHLPLRSNIAGWPTGLIKISVSSKAYDVYQLIRTD